MIPLETYWYGSDNESNWSKESETDIEPYFLIERLINKEIGIMSISVINSSLSSIWISRTLER